MQPPVVPTPAPMTSPMSPPPMPKKGMSPWLAVGIAAVVILAYVAFSAYAGMWPFAPAASVSPTPTASAGALPTASSTPTATISATPDTTGWKTYTNTQYGFSIKYPRDWNAVDLVVLPNSPSVMRLEEEGLGFGGKTYYLDISVTSEDMNSVRAKYPSDMDVIESPITISGQPAYKVEMSSRGTRGGLMFLSIYIPYRNMLYELHDRNPGVGLVDSVFPTFKFLK